MRFALALVTLLVAGVLVATGIAQRTVWRPADHVTVSTSIPAGARYVVVPAAVLRSHPGRQRIHIAQSSGSGTAFAAYGRTSDVTAWLAGERYAQVRVTAAGVADGVTTRTAPAAFGLSGGGSPDPRGSDLWFDQRTAPGALDWTVNLPAGVSLLVAADGATAAPGTVRITWPVATSTPFATPFVIGGSLLAVVGLLLYIWALVHVRRRRGPRRKAPPRMPKPPQPPRYRPAKPAVVAASRGRRRVLRRVAPRSFTLGLGLLAATTALAGCGAQSAPAAPSSSAATAPPATTASLTEEQAARIVQRVAATVAVADADADASALSARMEGVALQLRKSAYRIRAKDKSYPLPPALPQHADVRLILPEATTSWPRTLFVVMQDPENAKVAPVALTLIQADPRSDYRVQYEMQLQPGAKPPSLPSALVGGVRLAPSTPVLKVAPADLAAAYGVLLRNPDDPKAKVFDQAKDSLLAKAGAPEKAKQAKALGTTGKLTFSDDTTDPASPIAMSTAASGAIVSVNLAERWTAKPRRSGVTVTTSGATKILSKKSSTSKGFVRVYDYQLLFSVPTVGSAEPVVLLGYSQGLVSAKEL